MGLTPWRLGDFRWQGSLKDLFGFEIFDFGIFLVTLISGGIVSGYSKLMFLFFVLDYLILSGRFYGSENRHGIFGRFNFGPGICLGFVWIPRVFLAFDFCPHSIISLSWNPEYPPPPRVTPGTTLSCPLPGRASLQVPLSLDLSPSLPPKCLPIYYLLQYFFCSVFCIELRLNAKASTNGRVY